MSAGYRTSPIHRNRVVVELLKTKTYPFARLVRLLLLLYIFFVSVSFRPDCTFCVEAISCLCSVSKSTPSTPRPRNDLDRVFALTAWHLTCAYSCAVEPSGAGNIIPWIRNSSRSWSNCHVKLFSHLTQFRPFPLVAIGLGHPLILIWGSAVRGRCACCS